MKYAAITSAWRASDAAGTALLVEMLTDAWAEAYRSRWPDAELVEFSDRGACYLFDLAEGTTRPPRTVAAHILVPELVHPRDHSYQRG